MRVKFDYVQLVIFSSGFIINNKLKVANAINENLQYLLDADPMIVPIPEDAPSEIPRIRMSSKDNKYVLNIAKSRVDFFFRNVENSYEYLLPISGLFEKFLTISKYFKEDIHAQITRCSIVSEWVIELEKQTSTDLIVSKYIRLGTPIINPYQLELRYLFRESVNEFEVNKWTILRSATENDRFVKLLIDINTLFENTYDFDNNSLQKFFDQSSRVVNEIINSHVRTLEE